MPRETIMIDQQTSMRIDRFGEDGRILTWPTALTAKEMVRKMLGLLARQPATADWQTEVVATTSQDVFGFLPTDDYLDREEEFVVDQGYVVRFNCGPAPGSGFSVTVFCEDGITWLQGDFGDDDALARQAIEETIVPEGHGRADELLAALR